MTTLERAIETYGKDMQLIVVVEELSELIKEICKHKRGEDNRENIVEEIADCYIMLDQLILILGIRSVEIKRVIDEKLARLEELSRLVIFRTTPDTRRSKRPTKATLGLGKRPKSP